MFGQFSSYIVRLLIKNRFLSIFLLSGIIVFLVIGINRLKVQEDLYSVFPDGKTYQEFSGLLQKNNLNKQIIFSLEANTNEEDISAQLDQISSELENNFQKEMGGFVIYRSVNEKELIHYLQKSSLLYFSNQDYSRISSRLSKDSIDYAIFKAAERLNNNEGFFLRSMVANDPLGITNQTLSQLNPVSDSGAFVIKDGLIYTRDEKKILFFATLKIDPKNTALLTDFNNRLKAFTDALNNKAGHQMLDYFGTFQIAAENAAQIKKDTSITTIISLSLIFLLLALYYRSILAPFYFVLPAIFGILCGGGMVGFLHPDISAISLATSSVLIGIVLDYSLHFFTHYKHSEDLIETIRDISAPMVIGSFTTIAALAALMFTNSVVLQDFGLIALCVLSGSVIFTLFFLPVLLNTFKIKIKDRHEDFFKFKISKLFLRVGIAVITLYTVFSLWDGIHLSFDADLNNLSYHSASLKKKEEYITGINPEAHKKIYIFSRSTSSEDAIEMNRKVYADLLSNKSSLGISQILSVAPYVISNKNIKEAENKWEQFWEDRKDSTEKNIQWASKRHNFSEAAFTPFFEWMKDGSIDTVLGKTLSKNLGLQNLFYQDGEETVIVTSVVLDRINLKECKALLNKIEGIYVLDMADITEKLLNTVKDDLNYLLLFSGLLVFFSLLIVYGRIELALFALFPMVLSWTWILSLANQLDIKFNFVNIVITTFIFGLGDDFSIFTTDGLMQRYKTGRDVTKSYRSAIILSGLTTIFGTGALYFAKHPAVHSISVISVIGISCILFITLCIQPMIFNFFVTRRVSKGKLPITFFNLIYSTFLFLYFFMGSILLNFFLILFILPFPARKSQKRAFLNYLVSKLAKSTLYIGVHVKKRVLFPEKLDFSKPSIIVANHSSFLDILLVIMLNPKVLIMVKGWVYNSPIFGLFIRYAGYPYSEKDAATNLDFIKNRIDEGYSIVVFPEGTRSADGEIKRFHKGAFYIAKALELDIQPIVLIGAHEVNPKNDMLISKSQLIVLPLDRIHPSEDETYAALTKRVATYMRTAYEKGKQTYAKVDFWGPSVLKNYVLKGPVLEWYVRIKWKLEKSNYEFYDDCIGERKVIYDLGCGMGYLSYYLHYRNHNREIVGVDYDGEKIVVAAHGIKKNQNLSFITADLLSFEYRTMDVIFLNDVLHYLTKNDQQKLLHNLAEKLNEDGIIFIREGLKEDGNRFKRMKLTEILSTKVFKFNKVSNQFDFVSEKEIADFALKNGFTIKKIKHSKATSNVLLILHKVKNHSGVEEI